MKIAVLGAAGSVGSQVVTEALDRGHTVTAVVRDTSRYAELPERAVPRTGDAANPDDVAAVAKDHDVVVSAIRPAPGTEGQATQTTRRLLEGVGRTNTRLLIVGGAARLAVPDRENTIVLEDERYLPSAARAVAGASLDQYRACLEEDRVDWVYLSPPASLVPGPRTGNYRRGTDELLVDDQGKSVISIPDLAAALLDEVEDPSIPENRFTVAY